MMDNDLSDLNLDELRKLQKDVAKAIDTYQSRQKHEALAAAEAAAKEMGFTLAELIGSTKATKAAGPAKYRHPENPSITWSGRGRQPTWLKEAVDAGKSKDNFLISK